MTNLKELLPIERIALSVEVDDWESAVRASGKLLVDTGAAEERYIDAMVNTTKELGPYIVIAPGVAIPHSRPEDGVISTSLAFVRLNPPINFGNEANDPVKILFALGALDHSQHVEALKQIAEILTDQDKFNKLLNADTVDDVTAILHGL
jgi:mannitol/fructose-specific phosphotransferase system IIA component (Ntr-type)